MRRERERRRRVGASGVGSDERALEAPEEFAFELEGAAVPDPAYAF